MSVDLIGSYSGFVYLTTQIGPGTTVADQVAASSFASADTNFGTLQTVLQGVSIGPGTYFLVLSSQTGTLGLRSTSSPVIVADAGAATGIYLGWASGSAYAPADSFVDDLPAFSSTTPEFDITGDPTPEPATGTLLFAAIALLATRRNRRV